MYLDYKPWDKLYFHVGARAEKASSDYTGWGFPTLTQPYTTGRNSQRQFVLGGDTLRS